MNFFTSTVNLTSQSCSTPEPFDQSCFNPNNQLAVLVPIVVRPPDLAQGDWNLLTSDLSGQTEIQREDIKNNHLIEENEKLKGEITSLKQKLKIYEEIFTRLIPKHGNRDEFIAPLETLIGFWKNPDCNSQNIEKFAQKFQQHPANEMIGDDSSNLLNSNIIEQNELVELIHGTNVSLPRHFLAQTREMANDSPTYYMRRILAYFFDQETFAMSSARGKGTTKPLDINITKAVWEHTIKQFPNCNLTTLVEDTNRRCAEARRTLNRQHEGKKVSVSRTPGILQDVTPFQVQLISLNGQTNASGSVGHSESHMNNNID